MSVDQWRLIVVGVLLLLAGAVVSIMAGSGEERRVEAESIVYGDIAYSVETLVGIRDARIINGSLRLVNLGDGEVLVFIGELDNPTVLSLEPREETIVSVGPGYLVSVHSNNSNAALQASFEGIVADAGGPGLVILSVLLFASGTVILSIGVIMHILQHTRP